MNLSKLLPLSVVGGIGYTQQESIEVIIQAPLEAAQVVRARMEIGGIQRILLIDAISGDISPSLERDFPSFLRKNLISNGERDVSLDPWGRSYRVKIHRDEVEIWSLGPDGIDNNDDDIWATIPIS